MGNPPRISSWRSLLCFFFSSSLFFAYCVVLFLKEYWKAYLALFRRLDLKKILKKKTRRKYSKSPSQPFLSSSRKLRCVTSLKTAAKETSSSEIIISLLWAVVQNWNFDLSAGNLTGKRINLGFPWCITNSKLDSRGKRQGFDYKKPNWNSLWRIIWRNILKQTRLRIETQGKLLLYLDFRSHFEASSPNWCNVFCKILLQSIFLARIINKNKPKSNQLIPYPLDNL